MEKHKIKPHCFLSYIHDCTKDCVAFKKDVEGPHRCHIVSSFVVKKPFKHPAPPEV